MSFNFDFLNTVTLTEVPVKATKVGATKIQRNPEGLTLRVFASGKIYPSQELVAKFSLEYEVKGLSNISNGMDVFKSIDWPMFPTSAPDKYIFVGIVPKNLPKVDLFGQVGYEEDGSPKSSVLEQGGGSFGIQLLEMIKEVYWIEIEKGQFVDFEIKEDVKIKSSNDLYFVPKTVARGEKKGEITVVRRESIDIMPLVPVSISTDAKITTEDVKSIAECEEYFEEGEEESQL